MVSALFSIYSNVSDVGKPSDFISCACFTGKESLQTLQREVLCPTREVLHPTDKMLKKCLTKLQATCLVLQSSKPLLNQLVTLCCNVGKSALLFYKLCIVSMGNVTSIQ